MLVDTGGNTLNTRPAPQPSGARPAHFYGGQAQQFMHQAVRHATPSLGGNSTGGVYNGQNPYASDPGYQAAFQNEQQGIAQLQKQLHDQIAQSLVDYGDPNLLKQAGFGNDPTLLAAIKANYASGNSGLARLDKAHNLQKQGIINALAGRGILFSGETGYQQGNADQAYGNNIYDAQHNVLRTISQERQAELQQEQQLRDAVVAALENAFQNYSSNPGMYGYGGTSSASTGGSTASRALSWLGGY